MKSMDTIFTVVTSVLLSIGATLLVTHRHTSEGSTDLKVRNIEPVDGQNLKVKNIELIDGRGRVRATIGMTEVSGHSEPQIMLAAENGAPSLLLSLNPKGEGTMYFNSPDKEGKVAVGYIWGSDVYPIDREDPLGMWGLRVLGRNLQSVGLGVGNEGKPVLPGQ